MKYNEIGVVTSACGKGKTRQMLGKGHRKLRRARSELLQAPSSQPSPIPLSSLHATILISRPRPSEFLHIYRFSPIGLVRIGIFSAASQSLQVYYSGILNLR